MKAAAVLSTDVVNWSITWTWKAAVVGHCSKVVHQCFTLQRGMASSTNVLKRTQCRTLGVMVSQECCRSIDSELPPRWCICTHSRSNYHSRISLLSSLPSCSGVIQLLLVSNTATPVRCAFSTSRRKSFKTAASGLVRAQVTRTS